MFSNWIAQCYQGPKVPHETGFPTLFEKKKKSSVQLSQSYFFEVGAYLSLYPRERGCALLPGTWLGRVGSIQHTWWKGVESCYSSLRHHAVVGPGAEVSVGCTLQLAAGLITSRSLNVLPTPCKCPV